MGVPAILLVATGITVAVAAANSVTSELSTVALDRSRATTSVDPFTGGFTVLLVGSDTREGQGGLGGDRPGVGLNDVNMVLHVPADHSRATIVSIPRDLIMTVPDCDDQDADEDPFNTALSKGGLNCVARSAEELTGLDIPYAALLTFTDVIAISDTIGGVPVCVNEAINDPYSGLDIPAGQSILSGASALAFVRSRHGFGDGSDLSRINAQQVFLSSLVRTMHTNGTLSNPISLYNLAATASRNMLVSESLADVGVIASMALALNNVPPENVTFVQYPTVNGTGDYDQKVFPDAEAATALMTAITNGEGFILAPDAPGIGSATTLDRNTTTLDQTSLPVLDAVPGQTADQNTCATAYAY